MVSPSYTMSLNFFAYHITKGYSIFLSSSYECDHICQQIPTQQPTIQAKMESTTTNVNTAVQQLTQNFSTVVLDHEENSVKSFLITMNVTENGEFQFTDTHVNINLTNGEKKTKRRAHTFRCIAQLELSQRTMELLDLGRFWDVEVIETMLFAQTRKNTSPKKEKKIKTWFEIELKKKVNEKLRDVVMQDTWF
ncbi:hypothetical protein P280DRAFT_543578 [Massarina eburnea CBS 473.64]|uniref:Uncharacterized protein n=1 Tax=Massarina eburnea CBS 473.64 TaxID=1395130 RepID=A0A6A6RYW2_9PLEO|nr:hypothetical protein P280DRAFT_543578 [Massarina eburnea CBS 473.64]